jgi:DnaB helicase-like protein/bifunctional DNA primase/polymerase-like protein/primase-like protein
MSDLQDAAHIYAAQGFRVIPCEPKGKRPLVDWKIYQERQATQEEITQWWTDWPDANVALVLGQGLFAVDVDGPDGHVALKNHGIDIQPTTPTSLTGRGVHYFFTGTQSDKVAFLPHVDIRGKGIVIAPPSVHASGKQYTWLSGLEYIQEAPDALISILRRSVVPPVPSGDGAPWLAEALAGVSAGKRDATCTRLAGYFLGKGTPKEAVVQMLLSWADRCTPKFDTYSVIKCVDSIAQKEGPHNDEVQTPEGVGVFVSDVILSISTPQTNKLSTSLPWLDDMLDGGIEASDYILLGARPGIGKTALALQIARYNANINNGVLIVSREMGQRALTRRLICQESQVPLHVLKRGDLSQAQTQAVAEAGERLRNMPLWLSVARTIEDLSDHVRSYGPGALRLIVLDYLQLVRRRNNNGGDTRHNIDYISQELRGIANRYAPVLCLSSLSRPPKDVKEYEPGMGDLKESGELEHDADIVWLMSRAPGAELCSLKIAKNRDGRVGRHWFRFRGEILTMDERIEGIQS